MSRSGQHEELGSVPGKGAVISQHARHWYVFDKRVEIVADVIEVKNPAVAPKVLGICEQMPFMRRNSDRDAALGGAVIALALIAVMMRVQYPIDLADSHIPQVVHHLAGSKVDQNATGAAPDNIDAACILEHEEIVGQSVRPALRSEPASAVRFGHRRLSCLSGSERRSSGGAG